MAREHYYIVPLAINNAMQVTGHLTAPNDSHRSFILEQGRTAYFGLATNGGIFFAESLNNRGHILGHVSRPAPLEPGIRPHSMLWRDGELIDLSSLNGTLSAAKAINDLGAVVGAAKNGTSGTNHAFLWENGAMRYLPAGDCVESCAQAINNAGLVTGYAKPPQGRYFACLWKDGVMLDLNQVHLTEPGWRLVAAEAINDRGRQILARAVDALQHQRYFLLSPTELKPPPPQPSRPVNINLAALVPFSLSSFDRLPDGSSRLAFTGRPGVQVCAWRPPPNLTTWIVLGPATNDAGKVQFTDSEAGKFTMRFYRVALVPE